MSIGYIIYFIGVLIAIYPAYKEVKDITDIDRIYLGETFMLTLILSLPSWMSVIMFIWSYFDQKLEYKRTCQPYFPKARQMERRYAEVRYMYDYGCTPNEAAIKADEYMKNMYGELWYLYGNRGTEDNMEACDYERKIYEYNMRKSSPYIM